MEKKEKKSVPELVYVEPDDYFPKELLEKYFPELFGEEEDSKEEQENE